MHLIALHVGDPEIRWLYGGMEKIENMVRKMKGEKG